ncbi:MAG: hypothetical protein SVT56_01555 [Chloroflexota bacterium]|jgi:hypothetical protein|nr:hypothetical protein [Chloroflexota bacterium]
MNSHSRPKKFMKMFGFLLIIVLSACTPGLATITDLPTEAEQISEHPAVTDTQAPTATDSSPTALLLYSAEVDSLALSQTQTALTALAEQNGLTLVTSDESTSVVLTPNVRVVVGVGSGLDLNSLSTSNPDIRFVAVDDPDAVPADNLFVIGDPSVRQQRQAFMAGYLAAVISSDYKVGGIFSSEADADILNAYVIGAEYFCGTCRPSYPPYNNFPTWDFLSPGASESGFQPVVDRLVNYGVEILFLQGELISPTLLSYLSDVGILVVSDSPPDMARNNWVGTVRPDRGAALLDVWDEILSESSGVKIPASITLVDTEAGWVSEGRLRLFENMSADLDAGMVSTEYVP